MKENNPIVLIGPAHPLRGGIANFNESLCASLRKRGEDCRIVSFYMQYPRLLFPGKSQFSDDAPPENMPIYPWISSINPNSWYKTARKIRTMQPRFVAIRYWIPQMAPALGSLAAQLQKHGIPVIGLVDNAIPHEPGRLDLPLSKWFFKHCDAFFTLSENVADDLKNLMPGKPIHTHPHPVYDVFGSKISKKEARKNLQLDEDRPYILFFGFVRHYKGLDLLIRAMGDSRLKELGVKLIVAGEFYEPKSRYTDLIQGLDLGERVLVFDKFISQDEVKNYFCAANIVAQTYRTATQSGVTQIAYHFGRPMLVTDVGGLSEIVPDGRVGYVADAEPLAIADALVKYFSEAKEAEFSEAVEAEKARFSWDSFAEAFTWFCDGVGRKSS